MNEGVLLLLIYAGVMFAMTSVLIRRYGHGKELFLVAGRNLGQWEASFSIAATWIWAPALFIASQKAYTQGIAGVFWFTVPNIASLIIFGYFAARIRKKIPFGYTLAEYIKSRYSNRVHNIYLLQLIGLATCSFAVQLLAGGKVLSVLTGLPFGGVTLFLALTALSYSVLSGLKASVVTDYAQMIIILIVAGIAVPWAIANGGGWETVVAGLGGITGEHASIFDQDVFLTFGIAVTIGLLAGPFGDQSFWQRAYAVREGQVQGAFFRGALIFGVVPILMSLLGFLAAGQGLQVKDPALVNLEVIVTMLPGWVVIPFVFMLLSGLVSTLDSNLCSISALCGHDILQRLGRGESDAEVVRFARMGMFVLAGGALLIANVPGMKILYLFLFYGTLRASTLLPTIITLLSERIREQGVFWGIVVSLGIGLPLFSYAKLHGLTGLAIAGSLVTVFASGGITLIVSFFPKWWRRAA